MKELHPFSVESEKARRGGVGARLREAWFRLTTPPVPHEAVLYQERVLRARLASAVIFWMMVLAAAALPTYFLRINKALLPAVSIALLLQGCGLYLLRRGKILQASLLCVFSVEGGLMVSILADAFLSGGLDVSNLLIFDLLVQGVCAAASLLRARWVLLVALSNILWSVIALSWFPVTPILAHDLAAQRYYIYVSLATVQGICAVVTSLWLQHATLALRRADEAETQSLIQSFGVEQGQQVVTHIHTITEVLKASLEHPGIRVPTPEHRQLGLLVREVNALLERSERLSQEVEHFYSLAPDEGQEK